MRFIFWDSLQVQTFLIKLICLFIPLSRWRKKFRKHFLTKIPANLIYEYFAFPYYLAKRYSFPMFHKTLVVGSSHAMYGIVSDNETANLGMASQDLYYSWKLYEKFADQMPNLKNIIVFYSVFSPGFELDKCSEYYRSIAYRLYFSIDYLSLTNKGIVSKIQNYARKHENLIAELSPLSTPWLKPSNIPDEQAEDVAYKHLKNNQRNSQQNIYVQNIINLAQKHQHRIIIVIPPARKDYRLCLPDKKELFADILNIAQNNPQLTMIDFYDDASFLDEDFSDCNHLRYASGGKKLTMKLYDFLSKSV